MSKSNLKIINSQVTIKLYKRYCRIFKLSVAHSLKMLR
ncbi:hypothetical protein A1OE_122 [Candidatus Endolissoclinum faulkneri L2]|uniref:Uncharacterized protein n=1 Tax=Candidatus Endolissoclinum faulkneri L2 TaxID=1193729 RepID=K7Z2Y4_9PROT|nr:hypothetical protein A1OE_122 [Candidatus Endolissoclinum faulkneri L2]